MVAFLTGTTVRFHNRHLVPTSKFFNKKRIKEEKRNRNPKLAMLILAKQNKKNPFHYLFPLALIFVYRLLKLVGK